MLQLDPTFLATRKSVVTLNFFKEPTRVIVVFAVHVRRATAALVEQEPPFSAVKCRLPMGTWLIAVILQLWLAMARFLRQGGFPCWLRSRTSRAGFLLRPPLPDPFKSVWPFLHCLFNRRPQLRTLLRKGCFGCHCLARAPVPFPVQFWISVQADVRFRVGIVHRVRFVDLSYMKLLRQPLFGLVVAALVNASAELRRESHRFLPFCRGRVKCTSATGPADKSWVEKGLPKKRTM